MTYEEALIKTKDEEVLKIVEEKMKEYHVGKSKLYIAPSKPSEKMNFVKYVLSNPTHNPEVEMFCSNNDYCILLIVKPFGTSITPFITIC